MKTREMERALAAADPVARGRLDGLDFEAMEADLLADLEGEQAALLGVGVEPPRPRSRSRRRLVLALGSAALALTLAAFFILAGGASERPSRAYGAELVRFAESTPLLLLEGPGWRVDSVDELESGEGTMGFVEGNPVAPEAVATSANEAKPRVAPVSVRQSWVALAWHNSKLSEMLKLQFEGPVDRTPSRKVTMMIPALGTKVYIDTRAESSPKYGGPDDHEMVAIWSEDGHVLVLSSRVPDLAAFQERLGWLHRVDAQTWLDAMPAKVVKAADYGATVHEMLQGIPLPPGFDPAKIPDLRPDHRSLPGGRRGRRRSCLRMVSPLGRSPRRSGRRRRAGSRTRAAGKRNPVADLPRDEQGRRLPGDGGRIRKSDAEWPLVWQDAALRSQLGRRAVRPSECCCARRLS